MQAKHSNPGWDAHRRLVDDEEEEEQRSDRMDELDELPDRPTGPPLHLELPLIDMPGHDKVWRRLHGTFACW